MHVRKYDRVEALARAAELDAALHRAMRARGEALIDPRHIERAEQAANSCRACGRCLTQRDSVVIDLARGELYCAPCR